MSELPPPTRNGRAHPSSHNFSPVRGGPTPQELIAEFRERLREGEEDWRLVLFEVMAAWPLAEETLDGRTYTYLVEGEAFDWRRLAQRILEAPGIPVPQEEKRLLLTEPDLPPQGGDDESKTLFGVEKYRGYLNYLYGITVEQALLVAVEQDIRKRRVSRGYSPSDDQADEAYAHLYRQPRDELLREFRKRHARNGSASTDDAATRPMTLCEMDAFTYWLFKRRFQTSDPARIASDTRKGLNQLELMRRADSRRIEDFRRRSGQEARSSAGERDVEKDDAG